MTACTFCGSDVTAHDPVYVAEGSGGSRETAGQFCNYACLKQHIETAGLELGSACHVDCC